MKSVTATVASLAGLSFPLGTMLAVFALQHRVGHYGGTLLGYLLAVIVLLLLFQIARVAIALQFAPPYPRESYFGEASIAPEPQYAARREAFLLVANVVVAIACAALISRVSGKSIVSPEALALSIGVLTQALVAYRGMQRGNAIRMERDHRDTYTLYLRSFGKTAGWVVLGVAFASRGHDVVTILSPSRSESRSAKWYLCAVLFPVHFARIKFWTTSDRHWHRVANSLMNFAARIVIHPYGKAAVQSHWCRGITIEAATSLIHGSDTPIAYVVNAGSPNMISLPEPAVLMVASDPLWIIGNFKRFVARLSRVMWGELSSEEAAYLERYFLRFGQGYEEAMIRDSSLAAREGREDPRHLLFSLDGSDRDVEL